MTRAKFPGRSLAVAFAAAAAFAAPVAHAADAPAEAPTYDAKAHYTKYEYRIAMRDGTHLFTVVYAPKDTSKTYPVLMERTPYGCGPYGVDRGSPERLAPSKAFLDAGYIFVCQDVRGRFMSEGNWLEMTPAIDAKKSAKDVDESSDTHDTVQWLIDHVKGNNGRVGLWGISYPGFYTAASVIDSHPAIKAASPEAPVTDLFMGDDSYHGGAFMLAANFDFYAVFKPQANPTEGDGWKSFEYHNDDAYDYFLRLGNLDAITRSIGDPTLLRDAVEHDYYDAYWQKRAIDKHLKNVKAAMLTVGGWFDAEDLAGPLLVDKAIRQNNPGTPETLVMGPWTHGGWIGRVGKSLGKVQFAQDNSEFFKQKIMFPFFEQHLRGGADAKLPAAYVFETGSNVWRRYDAWPPREARKRTLWFGPHGSLGWNAPAEAQPTFDSYVSDPNRPVPYIAYATQGMPQEYMVSDQRFAATRPDVLVYETPVLDEDLTVAGPIAAKLAVSTTATDVDWVVKLIDVYPADSGAPEKEHRRGIDVPAPESAMGGYEQLVRGQPLRARFRHGYEHPEAVVPNQVETVSVELPDVNHVFRRGHRIMVQIQSSWFPLIDRNPQSFVTIRSAKPEDFVSATQHVYRWRDQPSGIELRVLE